MTSPTPTGATARPWRYTEGTNGQIRLMLGKGAYQLVYNVVGELNRLAEKANAHEELVAFVQRVATDCAHRGAHLRCSSCKVHMEGENPHTPECWIGKIDVDARALLSRLEREGGGK